MTKTPTFGETAGPGDSADTARQLRRRLDGVADAVQRLLEDECASLTPEQATGLEDVHRNATELASVVDAEFETESDEPASYRGVAYGGFGDGETDRTGDRAERHDEP